MTVLDYLRFAGRMALGSRSGPLYLRLFAEEGCNARCGHCRSGKHERRNSELTVAELSKISGSLGPLLLLEVSGGEPFLRTDLPGVIRAFADRSCPAQVVIPTNGSITGSTVEGTREILEACPGLNLRIDISIDGIGDKHDARRGYPGLFQRAVRTYRELAALRPHYPDLSLAVTITVSGYNHEELAGLYEYIRANIGPEAVLTVLLRGAPKDPAAKYTPSFDPASNRLEIDNYSALAERVGADIRSGRLPGQSGRPHSNLLAAVRLVRPDLIAKMTRERTYQTPCQAASLGAAMFSNGDVYACEMLREMPIGNIRDVDYDFRRLWQSAPAARARSWIDKTHCYCTDESQVAINILSNPRLYPRLGKEWAGIQFRRR